MKLDDYWIEREDAARRVCMLMITHSCNLNCTYCYEAFKSGKKMSFELAQELILKEVELVRTNAEYSRLEVDFMGGEPMMNFQLIRQIVEWAEKELSDIPLIFFLTSNGTLFDDEAKAWFSEHRQFVVVGVSYDGTSSMQKSNRNTKDSSIDLAYFHETWPFQAFHMTISKESVRNLAEGILEMQRKGYVLTAVLAQGVNWDAEDAAIFDRELHKLIDAYLQDPNLYPINLLNHTIMVEPSAEIEHKHQEKWCGSGTAMVTYDVDGKAYGCHMFSPIVLGSRAIEARELDYNCSASKDDEFCKRCVLKLSCPTCSGFNYRYRGSLATRDHRWCKMVWRQIRATCEFHMKFIAKYGSELDEDSAQRVHAAMAAYPVLCSFDQDCFEGPFIC